MEEHTPDTPQTPDSETSAEGGHEADRHDVRELGIGVEEEGVIVSDLFGVMLASVMSIACIAFVLYFVFFVTRREHARDVAADVPAARYVEQRELRAEAQDAYAHYALSPDAEGRYRIPIDAAMKIVERGATGGIAAPASRTAYNLAWLNLHPAPAIHGAGSVGMREETAPVLLDSTIVADAEVAPEPAEEPVEMEEETQ